MGIEPTNKGFADHLSSQCNLLDRKELTLDSLPVGPGLGPTLRLVLHLFLVCQYVLSRPSQSVPRATGYWAACCRLKGCFPKEPQP